MNARAIGPAVLVCMGGAWAATHAGFDSRTVFVGAMALSTLAAALLWTRTPRRIALGLALALAFGVHLFVGAVHERLRGERPFARPEHPDEIRRPAIRPPAAERPIRFVAWGDARGGASVFEHLREAIATRRPDFSIGLGDLIGMARRYQFEILRDQLDETGVPGFTVPGNHDLDPFGSPGPYESVFGSGDWRLDVRDVAFVALDSAAGPASDASTARFVAEVESARAAGKRVIAFTHHPPYPPNGWPHKCQPQEHPNTRAIQVALQTAGATTFSGDLHGYDRREIGRVTQYVSGGAGSKLEIDGLHHYLWVEVGADGVRVEKVDLPPRHDTPEFADRWTTFRDEAAYVARTEPWTCFAVLAAGALALGALLRAAVGRRARREEGGAGG